MKASTKIAKNRITDPINNGILQMGAIVAVASTNRAADNVRGIVASARNEFVIVDVVDVVPD